MAALEERLRGLAAGVIAGRFEVSDDPHRDLCRGCPGRVALCKWDESRTRRRKRSCSGGVAGGGWRGRRVTVTGDGDGLAAAVPSDARIGEQREPR